MKTLLVWAALNYETSTFIPESLYMPVRGKKTDHQSCLITCLFQRDCLCLLQNFQFGFLFVQALWFICMVWKHFWLTKLFLVWLLPL